MYWNCIHTCEILKEKKKRSSLCARYILARLGGKNSRVCAQQLKLWWWWKKHSDLVLEQNLWMKFYWRPRWVDRYFKVWFILLEDLTVVHRQRHSTHIYERVLDAQHVGRGRVASHRQTWNPSAFWPSFALFHYHLCAPFNSFLLST